MGITLAGQTFEHLVYHLVLTYSNWETGTICYSESLESLSEGWQNAVWELRAVEQALLLRGSREFGAWPSTRSF